MSQRASVASVRVAAATLHLSLHTRDRDIAVQFALSPRQVDTLRQWQGEGRSGEVGTGQLWRDLVAATGTAVDAVVVDVSGVEPIVRLRLHEVPSSTPTVSPCELVMLLSVAQTPVEVVTPSPPGDWDAALAEFLEGHA